MDVIGGAVCNRWWMDINGDDERNRWWMDVISDGSGNGYRGKEKARLQRDLNVTRTRNSK